MAASVSTGWASTTNRHLLDVAISTAHTITSAHPKCSDGIAANWLAKPLYGLPAP